jgi:hypothetical protein
VLLRYDDYHIYRRWISPSPIEPGFEKFEYSFPVRLFYSFNGAQYATFKKIGIRGLIERPAFRGAKPYTNSVCYLPPLAGKHLALICREEYGDKTPLTIGLWLLSEACLFGCFFPSLGTVYALLC